MIKYVGFNPDDLKIIKNDVNDAKKLAQRCTNALIYRPGGPAFTTQKLLFDTFMISTRDWKSAKNWDKAGKLRMLFGSFGVRMERVTCKFSKTSPTDPGEMKLGAFVKASEPNVIYLTPLYFKMATQKKRSVILIHEFIHLVQRQKGHPGGVKIIFGGQTPLGIPFDKAVDNPYCHQYFAEWL